MYKWIAAVAGFAMMAFELVAARLLAPTIGSSTFIWTNVIGVIMAALALGYWLGGKAADMRKREMDVVRLCFGVAILVTVVLVMHGPLIDVARSFSSDARVQGFVAALILFAPTSVLIGMISPYLAKLALKTTATTGKTIAGLSTYNAIGSILGTFLTGFFLFGVIGSKATLVVVIVAMLIVGWLVNPHKKMWERIILSLLIMAVVGIATVPSGAGAISIDTAISNYTVDTGVWNETRREVTVLLAGPGGIQSASYVHGEKDLVFWYTQEIAAVVKAAPKKGSILIIGGGAFSLPEYLGRKYPEARVDVVEIDPELEGIAVEYFRFEKPDNVTVYAEDARGYVNRTDVQYDIVIMDAFSDTNVPWQFVTREFGDGVADLLNEKGIVILNAITGLDGDCSGIYDAEVMTYGERLSSVYMKQQYEGSTGIMNRIFVFGSERLELEKYETVDISNLTPAYRDDFAPIEHLWQRCQSTRY